MANPWFRLYSKIVTDPKIEFLSFEDQRHFIWILCMKNEGYLDESLPNDAALDRMVARKLGLQGEAFINAKQRLVEVNLIDDDWQPVSWGELQYQSDSSKERTRKYRERKGKQKSERHGDVTVTVQDTDTDTDTDTEQRYIYTPSRFCPPDFYPNPIALKTLKIPEGVFVEDELEKFKAWEFARPKTDWDRAFHSWMLTAKPATGKPNSDTALRNLNSIIEEKYE